jgi:outer membrane protein OmpA-like peptidoglycan-associated protein
MKVITSISLIALIVCAGSLPAQADCPELMDARRATQSGTLQEAGATVEKVATGMTCRPWEEATADALLSERLILEARKIDPSFRGEKAAALIGKAADLDADWHAHDIRGRLQRSANDFQAAKDSFEKAINLIALKGGADAPATAWKNEATEEEKANLTREADEAKHLAISGPNGRFLGSPPNRAGHAGGVFSEATGRGAVGVRVPTPILFDYNSASLTRVGIDAAQEMIGYLKGLNPTSITITGHTDHVGSEQFNLDLSRRRAATVAAFLKQQGISTSVTTIGKGFAEPWKLSEGATYTQAQIDELNRRVEFDWH